MSGSPVDPRLDAFRRLLAIGILYHAVVWIVRLMERYGGLDGFLRQGELFAWTPGLYLPFPLHLLINWVLFMGLCLYLLAGRHVRLGAGALLLVGGLHFLGFPIRVPNHYLVALWSLALLAFLPYGRAARPLAGRALRDLCSITYVFSFFHKLNAGYFSIGDSPLREVIKAPLDALSLWEFEGLVSVLTAVLIPATILTELLLPILLSFRRTRFFGICLGFTFHGVIAIGGAPDYTAVILPFYVLYLDADEFETLKIRVLRPPWTRLLLAGALSAVLMPLTYLVPGLQRSLEWVRSQGLPEYLASSGHLLAGSRAALALMLAGLLFGIAFAILTLLSLGLGNRRRGASAGAEEPQGFPGPSALPARLGGASLALLLVLDAAYVLNCTSPYLGFKFYYSQAMFSGLESSATNHWLMPRFPLFRNDDYLRIEKLEFGRAIDETELQGNYGLRYLLSRYRESEVEANFAFTVLSYACAQPELQPIELRFERSDGATAHWEEACDPVSEQRTHPFNFYPWSRSPEGYAERLLRLPPP